MNKKEWLKSEIEELIDLYQSKPELWDVKSRIYRDRIKKQRALVQISEKFNTTVDEITRKIHNLRNQFNSELKKTLKKKRREGTNELYISKWPYFNSLSFLQSGSVCRSVIGNVPMNYAENNEYEEQLETQDIHLDENGSKMEIETEIDTPVACKAIKSEINHKMLKKNEGSQQSDRLERTKGILNETEDQYDVFGKYVANEMRSLSSEFLRRKMKRKFQKIILEMSEEEELLSSRSIMIGNLHSAASYSSTSHQNI